MTQQTRVFTVEPRPIFKDKDVWHLGEVRSSSNSNLLALFFFFLIVFSKPRGTWKSHRKKDNVESIEI